MLVNKKLDRLKQWSKEKLGAEGRTGTSEEVKTMMAEMELLSGGMEKSHKAMSGYVKSVSKQVEDGSSGQDTLPLGNLGSVMMLFGQEFEHTSSFGRRLITIGRSNQDLSRLQKIFATGITSSWLQSIERSLTQLKDYNSSRKKLDSRRLAFDAAHTKAQRSKKDDFRAEEELRLQKVKYEEANEELYRRMLDIMESEQVSMADLGDFLDAQLVYHEQSLARLKRTKIEFMASQTTGANADGDVSSLSSDLDGSSLADPPYPKTRSATFPAIRNHSYDDLPRKASSPRLHYERSVSSMCVQSTPAPATTLSGIPARRDPPPPPPPRTKKPPPPIPDKRPGTPR